MRDFFKWLNWNWMDTASVILSLAVIISVIALTGCISYAKVEKKNPDCRAVVRGYFFSFSTPAALEECRSDEDR